MGRIQLKRGIKANLPTSGLLAGEPLITTDAGTLHIAIDATTTIPAVPAIGDLTAMGGVDTASDTLIIEDASATGQKAKKITVDALKTALNIPAGSADEMVAVVSGGTAGYVYGTDGTDGIIRVDSSLSITKDSGNAYVTLGVTNIDGGTF